MAPRMLASLLALAAAPGSILIGAGFALLGVVLVTLA